MGNGVCTVLYTLYLAHHTWRPGQLGLALHDELALERDVFRHHHRRADIYDKLLDYDNYQYGAIAHIIVKSWDSSLLKDDELVFLHPKEGIVPEWVKLMGGRDMGEKGNG